MVLTPFEQSVYDFIAERPSASCVELARKFGEGNCIRVDRNNVITLFGVTEELYDVMEKLLNQAYIMAFPSNRFVYLMDGIVPNYPIVNKIPANGYKELHWFPVVYYIYDDAVKNLRLRIWRGTKGERAEAQKALELLQAKKAEREAQENK